MKTDIYQRITTQIVQELEQGVRPWMKPWSADNAVGRCRRKRLPAKKTSAPFPT